MKVYFNNKIFHFQNHHISSYHLLLKTLEKIGENKENIENYYLTSSEGFALSKGKIVKNGEKYFLKRRMKGSNSLYEKGNSYVITILGSIFFGVLSIVYYNFYINKTLIVVPSELESKFYAESASNSSKQLKNTLRNPTSLLGKASNALKSQLPKSTDISALKDKMPKSADALKGKLPTSVGALKDKMPKSLGSIKGLKGGFNTEKYKKGLSNFGVVVKSYWNQFVNQIQDDKMNLVLCNLPCVIPSIVVSKKQNKWAGILSFALFATYIFMLLMPLITNGATTISCKSPGFSKLGIPFLLLLIPLVLMFAMPFIIKGINILLDKLHVVNKPDLSNYKLAMSNTILIILLIVYLTTNRATISPLMGCMIIISLILFGLFKYFTGIDNAIGNISKVLGNFFTNSQPEIPEYNYDQQDIKNLDNFKPDFKKARDYPSRDCWMRYRFVFDFIWSAIMTLVGWGLMTGVYASQVRKHCKVA